MSTSDTLDQRYGATPAWRRRVGLGAVAVVALAFVGWLVWTIAAQSSPIVASEQLGFRIVDDNTATAIVQIQFRDDDVDAVCTVRAYAEDHSLVGELDFYPDPTAGDRFEEDISTVLRATSVESEGCTAPGQTRPR